ncbi:MAG: hypothetical protein ACOZCO_05895 [Bacteroidota bacterium]
MKTPCYPFLVLLLFLAVQNSTAQTCDSTQWAQPGTYEIQLIPGSTEASPPTLADQPLTSDQLCMIEWNRHLSNFVFLPLSPYTRVKIYPRSLITVHGPR